MAEPQFTFEVKVDAKAVLDNDEFYEKVNIRRLEEESVELWEGMPEESRRALLYLVHESLLHLARKPDRWLPSSLVAKSDSRLQIVLTVDLNTIDNSTVLLRRTADYRINQNREEVAAIIQELRDDDD